VNADDKHVGERPERSRQQSPALTEKPEQNRDQKRHEPPHASALGVEQEQDHPAKKVDAQCEERDGGGDRVFHL
jgi:hypothetical protein